MVISKHRVIVAKWVIWKHKRAKYIIYCEICWTFTILLLGRNQKTYSNSSILRVSGLILELFKMIIIISILSWPTNMFLENINKTYNQCFWENDLSLEQKDILKLNWMWAFIFSNLLQSFVLNCHILGNKSLFYF